MAGTKGERALVRLAARVRCVAVVQSSAGNLILPHSDAWKFDLSNPSSIQVRGIVDEVENDCLKFRVVGVDTTLSLRGWSGRVKTLEGKSVDASSMHYNMDILITGVGYWECGLYCGEDKKYPNVFLKMDAKHTPFNDEKWKALRCHIDRTSGGCAIVDVSGLKPFDDGLHGWTFRITEDDLTASKVKAREIKQSTPTTGQSNSPPATPPVTPPASRSSTPLPVGLTLCAATVNGTPRQSQLGVPASASGASSVSEDSNANQTQNFRPISTPPRPRTSVGTPPPTPPLSARGMVRRNSGAMTSPRVPTSARQRSNSSPYVGNSTAPIAKANQPTPPQPPRATSPAVRHTSPAARKAFTESMEWVTPVKGSELPVSNSSPSDVDASPQCAPLTRRASMESLDPMSRLQSEIASVVDKFNKEMDLRGRSELWWELFVEQLARQAPLPIGCLPKYEAILITECVYVQLGVLKADDEEKSHGGCAGSATGSGHAPNDGMMSPSLGSRGSSMAFNPDYVVVRIVVTRNAPCSREFLGASLSMNSSCGGTPSFACSTSACSTAMESPTSRPMLGDMLSISSLPMERERVLYLRRDAKETRCMERDLEGQLKSRVGWAIAGIDGDSMSTAYLIMPRAQLRTLQEKAASWQGCASWDRFPPVSEALKACALPVDRLLAPPPLVTHYTVDGGEPLRIQYKNVRTL